MHFADAEAEIGRSSISFEYALKGHSFAKNGPLQGSWGRRRMSAGPPVPWERDVNGRLHVIARA